MGFFSLNAFAHNAGVAGECPSRGRLIPVQTSDNQLTSYLGTFESANASIVKDYYILWRCNSNRGDLVSYSLLVRTFWSHEGRLKLQNITPYDMAASEMGAKNVHFRRSHTFCFCLLCVLHYWRR